MTKVAVLTGLIALVATVVMVSLSLGGDSNNGAKENGEDTAEESGGGVYVYLVESPREYTLVIDVAIEGIENFDAGQFDLVYDAECLRVAEIHDGSIGKASGGKTVVPVDKWSEICDGRIRVIVNAPGVSQLGGTGELASVEFAWIPQDGELMDGESVIGLENGHLNDHEGHTIPALWSECISVSVSVSVSVDDAKKSSLPDYYPIAAFALLVGSCVIGGIIGGLIWFTKEFEIEWRR